MGATVHEPAQATFREPVMRVGAREGHAIWSVVYNGTPNPLLELERRTVAPWLPDLAEQTFVDVACGTGRWAAYASRRGAHVFGADFCAPMLAASDESIHERLAQADAVCLPFPDKLADISICAFAAGYMDSPSRTIGELSRITRRGGHVLITDIHPKAVALGWRRSFRCADEVYEIENHAHPVAQYLAAADCHGLKMERIAEVPFGEPERPVFQQCGRSSVFDSMCLTPAIFALLWRRA
jgi:ubiquinone/menaquinone biosynthesis C-methylase UbiE